MHWFWCPACDKLSLCENKHCLNREADHPGGFAYCPQHKGGIITPFLGRNKAEAEKETR